MAAKMLSNMLNGCLSFLEDFRVPSASNTIVTHAYATHFGHTLIYRDQFSLFTNY